MQPVTPAYITAIKGHAELTIFSAEFGFVPPGAREGLTLASTGFGQLWGSRLSQLNNRRLGMDAAWMSGERNRNILNGQMQFIDTTKTQQTGDWSTAQSSANGNFATPPTITVTLDKVYDLIGVQIIFDDLGEEWATSVRVGYYNASNVLLQERTFANDRASMPIDWQYNGVRYIRYTLLGWNLPRRFAKVCQVIPGQIRYFDGDSSFSFLLRESVTPFQAPTIPEYYINFPNINQTYNIVNPEGLISKLRGRMEIPAKIGLATPAGIEKISVGDFPLHSWPDSAEYEQATFFCRPDVIFANAPYASPGGRNGTVYTVAQVAAQISTQAGFKYPIAVDSSLQSVQVFSRENIKSALADTLGQLATAAGGYLKFERNGSYSIKPLAFGAAVSTIYAADMWRKPDIRQMPEVTAIMLRGLNISSSQTEFLAPPDAGEGEIKEVVSDFMRPDLNRVWQNALSWYSHRLHYSIGYRGDPSIEAGDIINVETDYGIKKIFVSNHEVSYDGAEFLQGKIEGVGVD